nr:MAG TPA: hypothetical protein [Caudoviricetes sp.]
MRTAGAMTATPFGSSSLSSFAKVTDIIITAQRTATSDI